MTVDMFRGQARVRIDDDVIESVGYFPEGDLDPNIRIVDITPEQAEEIRKPSAKQVLMPDGSIVSDPPTPMPIRYTEGVVVEGMVHTADATPTPIWSLTLAQRTGYAGQATVIGVDSGNGTVKVTNVTFAMKRLNAAPVGVGNPPMVTVSRHDDPAATAWNVQPSIVGNDVVVTVTGAAGRPIDWSIHGSMMSFTPGGIGA